MQLFIDFDKMTRVFATAASEGRFQLFEYETYEVLSALGSESVPEHHLLARNHRLTSELLAQFIEEKVVLKVVSLDIVHKSDVGGVKVVPRTLGKVRSESRRMVDTVCGKFAAFLKKNGDQDPSLHEYSALFGDELCNAINKNTHES